VINLEHPDAPYIFATSRLISDLCDMLADMTTRDSPEGRQFSRNMILPTIVALRWIARDRFQSQKAIDAVDLFDRAVVELADLQVQPQLPPEGRIRSDYCPACQREFIKRGQILPGKLNECGRYEEPYPQRTHCEHCYRLTEPALSAISVAFGLDGI
jgi:hypothetical protein